MISIGETLEDERQKLKNSIPFEEHLRNTSISALERALTIKRERLRKQEEHKQKVKDAYIMLHEFVSTYPNKFTLRQDNRGCIDILRLKMLDRGDLTNLLNEKEVIFLEIEDGKYNLSPIACGNLQHLAAKVADKMAPYI